MLAPVRGLPDLVFTANAALVFRDQAVLARFRYPQRQAEEPVDEAWLAGAGFTVRRLAEGVFFEGAGDALFCGDTLFAGYRIRSDVGGHQQIGEMFSCRVIPLELVDPYYYHLDTCFCPLAPGRAIYFPAAFDDYGRQALAASVDELIEVDEQEARRFACNAVVVGRTVVTNSGCPRLHAALRRARLLAARNAARRIRQSRRQRQVPDPATRRRGRRRLEAPDCLIGQPDLRRRLPRWQRVCYNRPRLLVGAGTGRIATIAAAAGLERFQSRFKPKFSVGRTAP